MSEVGPATAAERSGVGQAEADRMFATRSDELLSRGAKPSSLTRDALRRVGHNPGAVLGAIVMARS